MSRQDLGLTSMPLHLGRPPLKRAPDAEHPEVIPACPLEHLHVGIVILKLVPKRLHLKQNHFEEGSSLAAGAPGIFSSFFFGP